MEFLDSGVQVIPDEIPRISRDIKDDVFLAVAQMSDADYLVTEDNDLLVLKTHGKTKIINALAFLDVLHSS